MRHYNRARINLDLFMQRDVDYNHNRVHPPPRIQHTAHGMGQIHEYDPYPFPTQISTNCHLVIALSGGPDSLCLLYLLQKHVTSQPPNTTRPSLRSLTIDHSLQPTSRASALRTHFRSISLGVPNTILPAEWGSHAHPPRGGPIEEAARDARYRALWRGIRAETMGACEPMGTAIQTETRIGAEERESVTVMFAHHADDQLETVVMRAARGTGAYGMGGMRSVRRWGMGVGEGEDVLRGMRTWVCRPLLSVSKVFHPPSSFSFHLLSS